MANARRENTPTEQNKEDNSLVLYRLTLVEAAVKAVGAKVDTLDNIKKSDLNELRDVVIERITDIKTDLQRQINELDANKADAKDLKDIRTLIKSLGTLLGTAIVGLVIYYLTVGVNQK